MPADEHVDGRKRSFGLIGVRMRNSFGKRIFMYVLSGLLLAGYLYVLYVSFHPQVTPDYRMRYIEEGYFYEERSE